MMRIYVGGLPFSTSSEQLEDIFAEFGTVTSAQVIEDKFTRQSRGFGFVEMENAEEGNAAISKLDGSQLGGRTLKVNEARPREEGATYSRGGRFGGDDRGGGGGGYGGGGGGGRRDDWGGGGGGGGYGGGGGGRSGGGGGGRGGRGGGGGGRGGW
ncbi:MAG: RNA-binding protein [Armatimonas sp.]